MRSNNSHWNSSLASHTRVHHIKRSNSECDYFRSQRLCRCEHHPLHTVRFICRGHCRCIGHRHFITLHVEHDFPSSLVVRLVEAWKGASSVDRCECCVDVPIVTRFPPVCSHVGLFIKLSDVPDPNLQRSRLRPLGKFHCQELVGHVPSDRFADLADRHVDFLNREVFHVEPNNIAWFL